MPATRSTQYVWDGYAVPDEDIATWINKWETSHTYTQVPTESIHIDGDTVTMDLGDLKAGTGQVTVRGWTIDMDKPTSALKVRVYIGGPVGTGERHDLGSFYASPDLSKENRCDLHPRWSRDGRQVCIDSVHEHQRQMYVLDVSGIVEA